jgi:ADP-ribose pyrophosphatase
MDLFVYGTLRHDPLFERVAGPGNGAVRTAATLRDYAVDRAQGTEMPMLLPRDGAVAEGVVWSGLTDAQRLRLDIYETAFGFSLRPMLVTRADGTRGMALVYVGPASEVSSGEPWSFERWHGLRAEVTCLAAEELLAHEPPLSPPELFRQWPMIDGRANAVLRARATVGSATRRYLPGAGDYSVVAAKPLDGAFFKLAALDISHRRFDSAMEGPLRREVLVGCDAALVLPYDPVRDRVLLVEQFRSGPARRGDPNPWSLEPVAGIVDAGETPEQAGLREAQEEAGLTAVVLERMFSFYPSPGASTDHFYCYLGLTDLPDLSSYSGGLAEEAEDLRLHVLGFEDAMGLVDSGEINAGPLIAMLLWVGRRRRGINQTTAAGSA